MMVPQQMARNTAWSAPKANLGVDITQATTYCTQELYRVVRGEIDPHMSLRDSIAQATPETPPYFDLPEQGILDTSLADRFKGFSVRMDVTFELHLYKPRQQQQGSTWKVAQEWASVRGLHPTHPIDILHSFDYIFTMINSMAEMPVTVYSTLELYPYKYGEGVFCCDNLLRGRRRERTSGLLPVSDRRSGFDWFCFIGNHVREVEMPT